MIMKTPPDNRVRTLLPFRVIRGNGRDVYVEFDQQVDVPRSTPRLMPFVLQSCLPVVKPILQLMEMYCALEDQVTPLAKDLERVSSELDGVKAVNDRLEKAVAELKRQNEALRKQKREG